MRQLNTLHCIASTELMSLTFDPDIERKRCRAALIGHLDGVLAGVTDVSFVDLHDDVIIERYEFDSAIIGHFASAFLEPEVERTTSAEGNLHLEHVTFVDQLIAKVTAEYRWR